MGIGIVLHQGTMVMQLRHPITEKLEEIEQNRFKKVKKVKGKKNKTKTQKKD